MPDTECDSHGRILGRGDLVPTPHRFELAGQTLYTWCALDTLIFPTILRPTGPIRWPPTLGGVAAHLVFGMAVAAITETAWALLRRPPPTPPLSPRVTIRPMRPAIGSGQDLHDSPPTNGERCER